MFFVAIYLFFIVFVFKSFSLIKVSSSKILKEFARLLSCKLEAPQKFCFISDFLHYLQTYIIIGTKTKDLGFLNFFWLSNFLHQTQKLSCEENVAKVAQGAPWLLLKKTARFKCCISLNKLKVIHI